MGSPQETVKPSDPELINLYYAELGRSYCDHLTVAVLQGSKEGHAVSLFPPGNTGTKNMPINDDVNVVLNRRVHNGGD